MMSASSRRPIGTGAWLRPEREAGVNMAKRITVPSILSVALMDSTCPASTVFAAANHMPTPPEMVVYEFNGHEGGEGYQWVKQVEWARKVVALA